MFWRSIANFDAALGHGRRTELLLAIVALMTWRSLLHSTAIEESATFHVLSGAIDPRYLSLPWLVYGILTLYGLVANIYAWPSSRPARMVGAGLGFALWLWVTLLHIPSLLTETMVNFSVPLALFSLMIFRSAARNLPPPGFPGLWR